MLALVVVAHGAAAGVLSTLGRLHTHGEPAAIVVLDDLRRGPAPTTSAAERAAERHGHAHGSALRHHHGAGDVSVDLADGAALQGDGDDGAASLAAFVAIVPGAAGVAAPIGGDVVADRLAWVPRTHAPAPFERPPRSV